MSDYISTENPDSLRLFFVKVNRDIVFRKNFLENPVEVLETEGIILSPNAAEEVEAITEVLLRKLPDLSIIPTGFDALLEEVASGRAREDLDSDPPMLIL